MSYKSMIQHCSNDELMLHWPGCSICYIGEFDTCIAEVKLLGVDLIGIAFLFPWISSFLSWKSLVIQWDKWQYWHYRILVFSRSTRSKLSGALFFLLKLSLRLIRKACFLSLEQRWVYLFKLKFCSIEMFLILDGILLILVLQSPTCFSRR